MEKILHPMHLKTSLDLQMDFLSDVYFDYQDYEIADWLKGLDQATIEEIIMRKGHELLKANRFVIPYTYLKYHVVPSPELVPYLKSLMDYHQLIDQDNANLKNIKDRFEAIFAGKEAYIQNPVKPIKKY